MPRKWKIPEEDFKDINFDSLAEKFNRKVYGSNKGDIRLQILWGDLLAAIPQISNNYPLKILDAGCGLGQISKKLAQFGHHVTLIDISDKMLDAAKQDFEAAGLNANIEFINTSFQNLDKSFYGKFDIILSHAVLEWLAEPEKSLHEIFKFLKPNGFLSLMFYNKNSIVLYNAVRGNVKKITKQTFRGAPNSLTPINPIDPVDAENWIKSAQSEVILKSGVRCLSDYIPKDVQNERSFDDLLKIEKIYNHAEPFISIARYIHFIVQKVK